MAKQLLCFYLFVLVFSANLFLEASAATDWLDVKALRDLYNALNKPPQLSKWKLYSGDPCSEQWKGVYCSGSSVIQIKLQGLNLNGNLGGQLDNLHNLKSMDMSYNYIQGEIPHRLPPNATNINFAYNNLNGYLPHSLSLLTHLRHLNLSHNLLSGPMANVFYGLRNLKGLDISNNNFSGDLPDSFRFLRNLNKLFLQNNKLTGSVIKLADLPLTDLNIQDNNFSGIIPEHFQSIPNLRIWGNRFHIGSNYPPWTFPSVVQNMRGPPSTQSSAIENDHSLDAGRPHKKSISPGAIGSTVAGAALVVIGAVLLFAIRIKRSDEQRLKNLETSGDTPHSPPDNELRDIPSAVPEENLQFSSISSSPAPGTSHIHRTRTESICERRKSHTKQYNLARIASSYSLAELQLATNSFSEKNLLGEGSLGSVYKAELPDGHVVAVKNINMVALSFCEEEQFMDVIRAALKIRHPNIVTLLGYCVENGQHLILYEYVRGYSLEDALHNEAHKPIPWGLRLYISLGIARALEYLHSSFLPPFAHCNLKAGNILLDEEHMPRITDTGLAILKPFTRNSVKLKASEIAIADTGYIAPEHEQPGDNTKNDVYAFGVLLLELLTGRRPFDSSRPNEEQSLANWASFQFLDSERMEQMVDPSIRKTFSSRALSSFADIVSRCIQPEEFRPQMSVVAEHLTRLLQKSGMEKGKLGDVAEVNGLDRSFSTTYAHSTCSSPPLSPQSAYY